MTEALTPAKRLTMVGTGTALAPFLSVLRDPETHDRFDQIIITHSVREQEELAYRRFLEEEIREDEIFGELLRERFTFYPTVTRGAFHRRGRITERIREWLFREDLNLTVADRATSHFMICGSIGFNRDMVEILRGWGMNEGARSAAADYVVERAFVG